MLNEAGSNVRVEDGVDLLGKDCVQSVGARLNWLCPCRNFNFERAHGTFSVVQFGRGEGVCEVRENRRNVIDSNGVPTRGVQREVFVSYMCGNSISQAKE